MVSELLLIHITAAILSYGAFSLSFVFSTLYLIQYHLLKQKKWGKRLWRIADLSKLEHFSYVLNMIGVPILMIGIILGARWAYIRMPFIPWYDPKVIGSIFVVVVYCIYIYLHIRKGMTGKSLSLCNVAAFLILLINFFLIGSWRRRSASTRPRPTRCSVRWRRCRWRACRTRRRRQRSVRRSSQRIGSRSRSARGLSARCSEMGRRRRSLSASPPSVTTNPPTTSASRTRWFVGCARTERGPAARRNEPPGASSGSRRRGRVWGGARRGRGPA